MHVPEPKTAARFVLMPFVLLSLVSCAFIDAQTADDTDDAALTATIEKQFLQDQSIKSFQIRVDTYNAVVQLTGIVDTDENEERAVYIAGHVHGVKTVRDNLSVLRKAP